LKLRPLVGARPLNSQEFLYEGEKAFNLVADPWFRFLSTIVIATKGGQQLWANPSRMAHPASRLASFASYILPLFRQNELVARNHP
jgi:hypothetical protein